MRIRSIVLLVIVGLLTLFVIVNWAALTTPSHLSLLITSIDAPVGVIMLGFTVLLAVALLSYAIRIQFEAMSNSRKHSEELRKQRDLADQAEASRFTDLRKHLELEMASLKQAQQVHADRLREELTAATNTLSAYIGEIDDRLERQHPLLPEQQP